jgi:hypothetical protein
MSDDRAVPSEGVPDPVPLQPNLFRLRIGPDNSVEIIFVKVIDEAETVLTSVWLNAELADVLALNIDPAHRRAEWEKVKEGFQKSRH